MKYIRQMQKEVREVNIRMGWYEKPVPFLQAMMLLVTEVAEAAEAWRQWGTDDQTPNVNRQQIKKPKPEGVGSEFADIFIRLLDDCERFDIDLEAEYERKMAFNRQREYRHGGKHA
jgi:NTP pyrophosphatase (non-canonical NTP hydrolase)